MSVFTAVSPQQLRHWLARYPGVGALVGLQGILAGVSNTNYFVDTAQARYVLTLFEHDRPQDVPHYLDLMAYLAARGIACPQPVADVDGGLVNRLNGKPAALVSCLKGAVLQDPQPQHCQQVGDFLARLHLAGRDYGAAMPNPRGPAWRAAMAERLMPRLGAEERQLLGQELVFQAAIPWQRLPQGIIHADLFRDNVLFEGDKLGGAVDFYYACNDAWAYDLAIAVNDWCARPDGALDADRTAALLAAYQRLRPLTEAEKQAWNGLLRAGALRFWLSRLHDYHFPPAGEMILCKDPGHFRQILQMRRRQPAEIKGN